MQKYLVTDERYERFLTFMGHPTLIFGEGDYPKEKFHNENNSGTNYFELCVDFVDIRFFKLILNLNFVYRLGLERGSTAAEALQVITTLLEKHGQVKISDS